MWSRLFIVHALFFFVLSISASLIYADNRLSKFLIVGDSLSAAYGINPEKSWVKLLQNEFDDKQIQYQVVNASISGETSFNGLKRLPDLLKKHKPDIVFIELGGNDGLRGLSLKNLKNNLSQMISLAQDNNAKVILAGMKIPPNYGPAYVSLFEQIYTQLNKQFTIGFIPFLLEEVAIKSGYMQNDGIHPNEKAQPLILNTVWPVIYKTLSER